MAAVLTDGEFCLLSRSILFCALDPAELRGALASPGCVCISYAKGDVIYAPHTFRRSLAVLLSGMVQVTKGELIISVLREGDLFGAAALFNDKAEYATTITARSASRAVFFSQALMTSLMERCPALVMAYVRYLSGRIRFLSDKIEDLTAGSAEQRLEQYLMAHQEGDTVALDCPVSALAKRLNMSRASLYRAFELLEQSGVIRREGKCIHMTAGTERNGLP